MNEVEQDMENTRHTQHGEGSERWPALPYEAWRDTCQTLHLWTQIVGKVRMELSPFLNHWWHVTLYVTPRGLTTSAIPFQNRLDWRPPRFVRRRHSTVKSWVCFSCAMTTRGALPRQSRRCWSFFRVPTKPEPDLRSGIARHWKGDE